MAVITITVYDEGRQHYEKFECERGIFLSSMRYFRDHVKSLKNTSTNDCQLSVYCDISVFSWLISYVKNPESQQLDDQNIIAILVSSTFLQMDRLVSECTKYISRRCSRLITAGAELASLSDDLLRRLSQDIQDRDMEALWIVTCREEAASTEVLDFVNKLYRLKMEHLLRVSNTAVLRCTHCKGLFSAAHISQLRCPSGERDLSLHETDRDWSLRSHVQQKLAEGTGWRTIYWMVWSVVTVLYCFACRQHFPAAQYRTCGEGNSQGKPPCSHSVLPNLGEPQQGTAISSVSRIKACIRCIQHLGCLEVAQDASISMVEPHRSVVEGHDTPSKLAFQQNSTLADVETDSEVSVPNAEEDVGSEDSALEGERSATARVGASRSRHARFHDCSPTQGGLLSKIGSNLLQLQDFERISEETAVDVSLRKQLCQEEDRRRMGVLQSFLETFREEQCSAVSGVSACPKRVNRPVTKSRPRQVRSQTGRPHQSRMRDIHA